MEQECAQLVERSQRAQLALQAASQWLSLRLQLLGVLLLAGVAGLALLEHHTATIDPGWWFLVILVFIVFCLYKLLEFWTVLCFN